jgi:anti-anti-sigma factor
MSGVGTTVEQLREVTLVGLAGAVDVYTASAVRERLGELDPARCQVVVDLSRVTLIDSAGMRELLRLRNRARQGFRAVGLICPRLDLRRIMEVTGLLDGFVVGDGVAEVEAALADGAPAESRDRGLASVA